MKDKITVYKSGALAFMRRCGIGYETFARNPAGEIVEKMRCDDYRMALEYYRAFKRIAKSYN